MHYATAADEASFWAEWQGKWDFVYEFVEVEKARIEAEEKVRQQGSQLVKARIPGSGRQSSAPGAYPGFPQAFFMEPPDEAPSGASRRSVRFEQQSVEYLPGYPKARSASQSRAPAAPAPAAPALISVSSTATWEELEAKLAGSGELCFVDVPWPLPGRPVLELAAGNNAKKVLRAALLRWHPDKFQKILARIAPAGKAEAVAKVQEVTRRIIAEKNSAGL
jgi:hypothetical protein